MSNPNIRANKIKVTTQQALVLNISKREIQCWRRKGRRRKEEEEKTRERKVGGREKEERNNRAIIVKEKELFED